MSKYKACDFFMVRTPLISTNDYISMFNDPTQLSIRLDEAFNNPLLKEALAVASKDLLEAINKNTKRDTDTQSKSSEQIRSSLARYFIRLSTRPTPFGLFSGISIGQFGASSNIIVSTPQQHVKRARPDMEWVYGFIKKIESNKSIRNHLRVRFNDFTNVNGNRIEKPNKTFMQHGESPNNAQELSSSIRYTGQVKIIEEKYNKFHPLSCIFDDISSQSPNVPASRIETFLSQLMENEFLLSELRPPLTNTDMLDYLLQILNKINDHEEICEYIIKLKEIKTNIESYNATSIGEGIDIYNEIIRLQSELFKCNNYLQVDMKTNMKVNMLDNCLRDELNQFVTAMHRLATSGAISDEMAHYMDLFLEKYGYSTEIPVLELLDMDKGLGAPTHYGVNAIARPIPRRQKNTKEEKLKVLMDRKQIFALREGMNAIEITNDDIDEICEGETKNDEVDPMDCQQSFELYLLAHPSADNYFTVAPMSMSNGYGKSFGRFSDMLAEEELTLLNNGFKQQKDMLPEYIIAEIAELPPSGRTSNVSINNSGYDYQIPLTTNPCEGKHMLSIRDLYIGIERGSNQFYVKSKSLNKKVIVTMTCMVNPTFGSNILRFLREISAMRKTDIVSGIWNALKTSSEYSPRVTYGKIIIRPETWQITKRILGIKDEKKNNGKNTFEQKFASFRKKWRLPQFVFFNEGDNRLMLDLDNPTHIAEICNAMNKSNFHAATLTEATCNLNEYAAKGINGENYATEIVVPFFSSMDKLDRDERVAENNNIEKFHTLSNISTNSMSIKREQLLLLPGNENWLYYKLYGCSKRQDELILTASEVLEKFVSEGIAQQYFFIRYSDPEPHLRLRIKPTNKEMLTLFANTSKWLESLYASGLISKALNDSYLRETERYGGPELVEYAEDYFCNESKFVMYLLAQYRYGERFNIDCFGISFIISVLEAFGLSSTDQLTLLSSLVDKKSYKKEFQNNRNMIMHAVDGSDSWFTIRSFMPNPEIYDFLTANAQELKKYSNAIYFFDQKGKLTNSIREICLSIIHMFCNRIMGNNVWERKIFSLARHGVHGHIGFSKHRKTKHFNLELPATLI